MTQEHPITPPPELYRKWEAMPRSVAFEAAYRAGADQELEACCEWLVARQWFSPDGRCLKDLRAARRHKPPSLKEQSLALIDKIQGNKEMWQTDELDVVRRALESLPD